jgi:tRNA (guanine-N7-)-methyltransferase
MAADRNASKQHRAIRSFVRRAGRLTPSQQRALDELWPEFGVDFETKPLDFAALFGRTAPVVLEIGFGNGETLVQQAAGNPDQDYIGIEVHDPGVGHCLIAARNAHIRNLRLIVHDAIEVLEAQIPVAALQRINLYFPDPWPIKRHHKRRILQEPFLAVCASRLTANGALHIATDWAGYAEHIDALFAQSGLFVCAERRRHEGEQPLDRPMTKFERRGLKKGHGIWDWKFEKACRGI